MDDNQLIDQLTEGITPFQPESGAITEVVLPATSPEFTPAPVITSAEVAAIDDQTSHETQSVENELGSIAVGQAEQAQHEAAMLIQEAPALEAYTKLAQLTARLKKANMGKLATVGAGAALTVGTALADRYLQLNGALDIIVKTSPMAVAGASLGEHKDILGRFVENTDDLNRVQKTVLKVGNIATGAAVGAIAGLGVDIGAEHAHQGFIKPVANGFDDALVAGGAVVGAVKKQAVTVANNLRK